MFDLFEPVVLEPFAGLTAAITSAVGVGHLGVMCQAVQQRAGQGFDPKHFGPCFEGLVGSDDEAGALAGAVDGTESACTPRRVGYHPSSCCRARREQPLHEAVFERVASAGEGVAGALNGVGGVRGSAREDVRKGLQGKSAREEAAKRRLCFATREEATKRPEIGSRARRALGIFGAALCLA